MATLDEDRDAVRSLLLEAESLLRSGDPDAKASNVATARMERIAQQRDEAGQVRELLGPLLADDEDKHVRFGVASFLLSRGHSDLAVPVLESIDVLEAELILRRWRRDQQNAEA